MNISYTRRATADRHKERNVCDLLPERDAEVVRSRIPVSGSLGKRACVCLVAALLAMTIVSAGAAWAAGGGLPGTGDKSFNPAGDSEGNHCVSPEGVDANQLLGVSEQLFLPGECEPTEVGEFWVPFTSSSFVLNSSWQVPADYTPSASTPLEDFVSKVRSMTYIVDAGTSQERSYRFRAQDIMDVRSVGDFFPLTGPDPDWPWVFFLAKLPPLPPGDHTLTSVIEMSARSCDGFGTGSPNAPFNCLDAGTTRLFRCTFTVASEQSPSSRP
jgi:hypothetical protein